MKTSIFVDGPRLRSATTKSAIFFSLCMATIVFIFLKFNIFQSIPILRIACLLIGIFITVKWFQALKLSYDLASQKEPCVTIHEGGLTFIKNNMVVNIPWHQVVKVELIPYPGGVALYLTQDTNIEDWSSFAKLDQYVVTSISYVTIPPEQLIELLLIYKDRFSQQSF